MTEHTRQDNLNDKFEVLLYTGEKEREGLELENIFDRNVNKYHCSKVGFNFDLILKYVPEGNFTLSNFVAHAPFPQLQCTAPLKNLCVFVSEKDPRKGPDPPAYSKRFNNIENEGKFLNVMKKSKGLKGFYLETDDIYYQVEKGLKFNERLIGKYLHIKFINPHAYKNIDIAFVGIYGYHGDIEESKFLYQSKFSRAWGVDRSLPRGLNDVTKFDHTIWYYMSLKFNLIIINDDFQFKHKLINLASRLRRVDVNIWCCPHYNHFGMTLPRLILRQKPTLFKLRKMMYSRKPYCVFVKASLQNMVEDAVMYDQDKLTIKGIEKFLLNFKTYFKTKAENLTHRFSKVFYNGGVESFLQSKAVENILNKEDDFHCSDKGQNFDLVLKFHGYNSEFSMTNFSILGPQRCTAPIHTGCVFVHKGKPNIKLYTKDFDNCTKKNFASLIRKHKLQGFFFETDDICFQDEIKLKKFLIGSFIHIKFIAPHKTIISNYNQLLVIQQVLGLDDDDLDTAEGMTYDTNIDVLRIGIVGGDGSQYPCLVQDKIPLSLGLTVQKYFPLININRCKYVKKYFKKRNNVIMVTQNQSHLDLFEELSKNKFYGKKYNFFTSDYSGAMISIMKKRRIDIKDTKQTHVFVRGSFNRELRYFDKREIVKKDLEKFMDDFVKKAHDLTHYFDVLYYNGGTNEDVKQILRNSSRSHPDESHFTKFGRNFDLVLSYRKDRFMITNFSILSPFLPREVKHQKYSPVKTGIIFVSDSIPKVEEYSEQFNDCTAGSFKALLLNDELKKSFKDAFYFTTDDLLQFEKFIPEYFKGKYIHIKFISPHDDDCEGMAIQKVAFVGYEKVDESVAFSPEIEDTMDLTRKYPHKKISLDLNDETQCFHLNEFFEQRNYSRSVTSVVLFSKDNNKSKGLLEVENNRLKEVGMNKFRYFYSNFEGELGKEILGKVIGMKNIDTSANYMYLFDEYGGKYIEMVKDDSNLPKKFQGFLDKYIKGELGESNPQAKKLNQVIKKEASKHYSSLFYENYLKYFLYTIVNTIKSRFFIIEIFILFFKFQKVTIVIMILYCFLDIIFNFFLSNCFFYSSCIFCCFKKKNPPYRSVFEYILETENNYENPLYKFMKFAMTMIVIVFAVVSNVVVASNPENNPSRDWDFYSSPASTTPLYIDSIHFVCNQDWNKSAAVGVTDEEYYSVTSMLSQFVYNITFQNGGTRNCTIINWSFLEYYKGLMIGVLNLIVLLFFGILFYDAYACNRYVQQVSVLRKYNIAFPNINIRFMNMVKKTTETMLAEIISGLFFLKSRKFFTFSKEDLKDEALSHLDLSYFKDLNSFELGFLEYFFTDAAVFLQKKEKSNRIKERVYEQRKKGIFTIPDPKRTYDKIRDLFQNKTVVNTILGSLFVVLFVVAIFIGIEFLILFFRFFYPSVMLRVIDVLNVITFTAVKKRADPLELDNVGVFGMFRWTSSINKLRWSVYGIILAVVFFIASVLVVFFLFFADKYEKHVKNFFSYPNYLLNRFGWLDTKRKETNEVDSKKVYNRNIRYATQFCCQKGSVNCLKRLLQSCFLFCGGWILVMLLFLLGILLVLPVGVISAGSLIILTFVGMFSCCMKEKKNRITCKTLYEIFIMLICSPFLPFIICCYVYVEGKENYVENFTETFGNAFCLICGLVAKLYGTTYKYLFQSNFKNATDIMDWGEEMMEVNTRKMKKDAEKIKEEYDLPYIRKRVVESVKVIKEKKNMSEKDKQEYLEQLYQNILLYNFRVYVQDESLKLLQQVADEKLEEVEEKEKRNEIKRRLKDLEKMKDFQFELGRWFCKQIFEDLVENLPLLTHQKIQEVFSDLRFRKVIKKPSDFLIDHADEIINERESLLVESEVELEEILEKQDKQQLDEDEEKV